MTPSKEEVKAENAQLRAELSSLKVSLYEALEGYLPKKEMSLHDKAVIGIGNLKAELSSLREKIVEVAGESWDESFANVKTAQAVYLETFKYMKQARTEHLDALKSKINSSSPK